MADADRLNVRPLFPCCQGVRVGYAALRVTCVLSIITSVAGPPSAASALNTARHTPLPAQPTSRLYSVFGAL